MRLHLFLCDLHLVCSGVMLQFEFVFCLVRGTFSRTDGPQVETLSNVLTMHVSFLSREKKVAPDTCAAGVAP